MSDYIEFHLVFFDPRPLAEVGAIVGQALEIDFPVTPSADFGDRRDQDRCVGRTLGMEVSLRQGQPTDQGFTYRLDGATRSAFSVGDAGRTRLDASLAAVLRTRGIEAVDSETWRQSRTSLPP